MIAASDARSSVLGVSPRTGFTGLVNGHGNVVHAFFDGLGRPVKSELLMKTGGQGNGQLDLVGSPTGLDLTNPANADGKITIRQSYDRSSRLVSRQDDNGNTTSYAYDARDRGTYVVGADLTVQRSVYDADSNVVETIDRNGTTIAYTHDGDHRVVKAEVTRRATNLEGTGQGVEGTGVMAWEYDGLSRPRVCVDQNDPADPNDDVATSYTFDSLSRPLTERHRFRASTSVNAVFTQFGRIGVGSAGIDKTISRTFDLDSNRTSTTYSSGRTISYGLDGADRIQQIVEGALGAGSSIQTTEWIGGRPLQSDAGNGVRTSFGYDGDRRLTSLTHVGSLGAGTNVASFGYAWTRGNQRASETFSATGMPGATQTYSYDSASRLVRVAFAGGAVPRPDTTWLIDGVGNQVRKEEDGQTTALNVRANGRYLPDLMNEVATFTRFDATASVLGEERHVQDPNGSRIKDGQFKLYFDAFERLVRVERASDGVVVGRYRYDAAGRRVDRQFRVGGGPLQQVFHVHDGAQEVEEIDGSGAVQADFVWGGLYVDQLVQMRRGGGTYYAHANSVFSVVALTDASGAVAERYGYSSVYGVCQVQNADGSSRSSASEVGNPWRFQGRRFDPETGWIYFRARFLDPGAGRWVSRDPLGIWGDAGQIGNAYSFCGNDPVNGLDPSGLATQAEGLNVHSAALAQTSRMLDFAMRAYISELNGQATADLGVPGRKLVSGSSSDLFGDPDLPLYFEPFEPTWITPPPSTTQFGSAGDAAIMIGQSLGTAVFAVALSEAAAAYFAVRMALVSMGVLGLTGNVPQPATGGAQRAAEDLIFTSLLLFGFAGAAGVGGAEAGALEARLAAAQSAMRSATTPEALQAALAEANAAARALVAVRGSVSSEGLAPIWASVKWQMEFVKGKGVFHWKVENGVLYASIGQIHGRGTAPWAFFFRLRALARANRVSVVRLDPTSRTTQAARDALSAGVRKGQLTTVVENGKTYYEFRVKCP